MAQEGVVYSYDQGPQKQNQHTVVHMVTTDYVQVSTGE